MLCVLALGLVLGGLEAPGWQGTALPAVTWTLDGLPEGATAALHLAPDNGADVHLAYDLGTGPYVQMFGEFAGAIDLSRADLFGLDFRATGERPNHLALMFVDATGMFAGLDLPLTSAVGRWVRHFPLPRATFARYWGGVEGVPFDWSRVVRVFVTVKRPSEGGGGSGALDIARIHWLAADEAPLREGERAAPNPERLGRAVGWLVARQGPSGFLQSWREEAEPRAYLYDQALALLALERHAPAAAARLVAALVGSLGADGRWPRVFHATTGQPLGDDPWLGDQAWAAFALARYGERTENAPAREAARRAAGRLAGLVATDGSIEGLLSTEGTIDLAWALRANGFRDEADRVAMHLFERAWDDKLGYFRRGVQEVPDPVVALDCQTWGSALARAWNRPEVGARALSFARMALVTRGPDEVTVGLDGQGPLSPWPEGMGQYVAAGGPDSGAVLAELLRLQSEDGGMPGGLEELSTGYGWITRMHGVAATSWLVFALTESPFE